MHSNSIHHDAMNPAGAADAQDQDFLDEVFERAVRLVEDGLIPETDALLAGHEALRAEVERLVQLARHVAVGAAAPLPALPGFTILQQLGQGGMGTVYLARQHSLGGRPVALKVLPNSAALSMRARARFLAEASAIARLRHPNIVAVHDVVHQGDVHAYAMEWVDGSSLADTIDGRVGQPHRPTDWDTPDVTVGQTTDPPCGIPDICRIGLAIARALEAVHAAGLLHRDVKPSNILLRRDGTPLLADFGLAREMDSSVNTHAGLFAGTVAYAPPEQLRGAPTPSGDGQGEGGVDARSDIYALGVTLYHALARRLPFEGRNPATMLRRIEAGAATPLRKVSPRVPRDLETIVAKAMEADPARRYQTAGDFAADLERFMNYQPIRARPAGLVTRGVKLVRRNRGAALGVTIGGILAMGLAGLLVTWFFFVPGWTAGHVREARLVLLDPGQANCIVSNLYWGRTSRLHADAWEARLRDYDRALNEYNAALRLAPFDEAIRRERAVVQAARNGKTENWNDPRSAGLYGFLTQDYVAALAHWAEYDKSRNPLDTPDALVDAALGILYLFDDKAARAYPRLQHAVEAFPGVRFLMEYLADAAVKCGDVDRAEQWLNESKPISLDGGFGARDRVEAALLAARGRTDEAIAAYERIRHAGVTVVELARLLDREGRTEEALTTWRAASWQFPRSARVQAAFVACADRWWAVQPTARRRQRIESTLDNGPESIVAMLRQYQASIPPLVYESRTLADAGLRPGVPQFQIFDSESEFLAALYGSLSSPPLESLSLSELAQHLEVENMSLWSRISSFPGMLKELQIAAWRRPALRPLTNLAARTWQFAIVAIATVAAPSTGNAQCSAPPCFQGLGDLPGGATISRALQISADGTTVVGDSKSANSTNDFFGEPFRWRAELGMVGLGDLPGQDHGGLAYGVSADGAMVAGWSSSAASCVGGGSAYEEGFRWTQQNGMVGLGVGEPGCCESYGYGMADDGTICGSIKIPGCNFAMAIATNGNGFMPVTTASSNCYGISRNGQWIIGESNGVAARWSAGTGLELLNGLPSGSFGFGVSNDGAVIGSNGSVAFLWTATAGLTNLGDFPGGALSSLARKITTDGSLIVGDGSSNVGSEAAIWDETRTLHRLADVLIANGAVIPPGWTLRAATGIAVNGNSVSICGVGTNPLGNTEAWIARYSTVPPCQSADVLQSPASAGVPFGGTAQFSVVATGTGPLTYLWRKNNVPLTDGPVGCGGTISGATTDTLVLNTVTFVEGGNYDCVVTNACGNDTSAAATLTINPPPAAADVNHDGQVNGADIQALVNALLAP